MSAAVTRNEGAIIWETGIVGTTPLYVEPISVETCQTWGEKPLNE